MMPHAKGNGRVLLLGALLVCVLAILVGCADTFDNGKGASMTGGDPTAGREKIILHDCHSCHYIPGVPENHDRKGPSLKHWSRQGKIAGKWPNNAENLEDFIQHPERMLHGKGLKNEMTMSNVKPADAKDIAAYLFSIQ